MTRIFRQSFRQCIVASALLLASVASHATAIADNLAGNWAGNWSGSGITAIFDMMVGSENSAGQFTGNFNWTCTGGISCSGIENFAGLQVANNLAFATTSFINPVNLGASTYTGVISSDGLTLRGTDSSAGQWTARKVLPVTEPSTLALMLITLGGMLLASRKRSLFGKPVY